MVFRARFLTLFLCGFIWSVTKVGTSGVPESSKGDGIAQDTTFCTFINLRGLPLARWAFWPAFSVPQPGITRERKNYTLGNPRDPGKDTGGERAWAS